MAIPELNKTYTIKALHSDQAMVVYMGSAYDGANIVQMPEAPGYYQQWTVTEQNSYGIRLAPAQDTSLKLTVESTPADPMGARNNAPVKTREPDGSYRQYWMLEDKGSYIGTDGNPKDCYTLTSTGSSYSGTPRVLCVEDASTTNGANVIQYSFGSARNDLWYFEPFPATNRSPDSSDAARSRTGPMPRPFCERCRQRA